VALCGGAGIAQVGGLVGARGGVRLVCRRGVLGGGSRTAVSAHSTALRCLRGWLRGRQGFSALVDQVSAESVFMMT
jgi:hypothetical protein